MLPTVQLGSTNMWVTRLGYGAMELRGLTSEKQETGGRPYGRLERDDEAGEVLNAVLDAGINFVDTARFYARSEEYVGRYISHRRRDFYLATKFGNPEADSPDREAFSRDRLWQSIEHSLKLLQTDHVDLLQLHNPTLEDQRRFDCISTLKEVQAQGLTRYIGVSSTLPAIEEYLKMGVFDTFQIPYSLIQTEHEDVIKRVAESGAGTIIRGGIAQGMPAGGTATRPSYARAKSRWDKLGIEQMETGIDLGELTLRYTLSHPGVHTVIVGTINKEHIRENAHAAERGPLPADLVEEVRKRTASV